MRRSALRTPLGVHVSAQGGVDRAVERARAIGCTALQMFARNPRGWSAPPLGEETVARFRALRAEWSGGPVAIHTMYLINLASADADLRERSIAALAGDLERAERLGCEIVVTHLGSAGALTAGEARRRTVRALDRVLRATSGSATRLLLENAAGQGRILGCDFEELARLREGLREPARVGFAIDSAHLFASGVDPRVAGALDAALEPVLARGWGEALGLIHLNDSKTACGSRHDRHEHLGLGLLARAGLRAFLTHPALRGVPVILETPFDEEGADVRNLRYARRLLGEVERAAST